MPRCFFFALAILELTGAGRAERIRAGYVESPPMVFHRHEGKLAGFIFEVFDQAARRAGIELVWRPIDVTPDQALSQGLIDIWPGGADFPERRAAFYLTTPWWRSELLVLARADRFTSPEQLGGKRVAHLDLLRPLAARHLPGSILVGTDGYDKAVREVCKGTADAAFLDRLNLDHELLHSPDECRGQELATLGLPGAELEIFIVAGRRFRAAADGLRERIDDLARDGKLVAIAGRYPPVSSASAEEIASTLQARYDRNLLWVVILSAGALVLAAACFIHRLSGDIAARRRAAMELERSQAQLARAHRIAALGHWEVDLRAGRIDASESARATLALPQKEGTGIESLFSTVDSADRERVRALLDEIVRSGASAEFECAVRHPDRGLRFVRQHAEALRDTSGQIVCLAGTVQDITEYRRLEEQFRQAQKLETVGRLAGGVAHDFNNLLTIINGYADLLATGRDDSDPLMAHIVEIRTASERAAALTRQLLTFSRKNVVERTILDLNAAVAEAEGMLRRLVGENIELSTVLTAPSAAVRADANQVQQLLLNLVVNARDAMPEGGTIRIETRSIELDEPEAQQYCDAKPGTYVVLSVADTGTGMDAETKAHLFEPFYTTKPKGKGTGLGLSTVYGIVRQNDGFITVRSELGQGTTFNISLPLTAQSPAPPRPAPAPAGPRGTGTVLVVEDERAVRTLAAEMLRQCGYRVLEASDGEDALALLRARDWQVDLVVTDVLMPGMNGPELVQRIRAQRPGVAVLFMSGYTDTEQKVVQAGFPYLQKPFAGASLTVKVDEVLHDSHHRWRPMDRRA